MANGEHSHEPAEPYYSLNYGMRLEKGTAPEMVHPHVEITLPDGSQGVMALHVINGTADEIKEKLLESVDAFFDIYTEAEPQVPWR